MNKTPRLANLECKPFRFLPGDRILVRTNQRLDKDAEKRIRKTIEKWAGVPVEVLIYCILDMEIQIEAR
jgi:hypothetical protein